MSRSHLFITALLLSPLAACGSCNQDDDEETVVIPESLGGDDDGSATAPPPEDPYLVHPELPPQLRELPPVHDVLPSEAQFEQTLVVGDWTTYRGNMQRTGMRDAPAIQDPFIDWSVQIGIQGYANTPLVIGERVFVSSQGTTHNEADNLDGVTALNPQNGAVIWRQRTSADANGMTYHDGMLLVGTDDGDVYAFSADNGAELWVTNIGCSVYQGPTIQGEFAHVLRSGETVRLNLADGSVDGELPPCATSERGSSAADGDFIAHNYARGPAQTFDAEGFLWAGIAPEVDYRLFGSYGPPMLTAEMVIFPVHAWPFPALAENDTDGWVHRPSVVARWRDNGQLAWATDINTRPPNAEEERDRRSRHLRGMPWISGDRLFWSPTTRSVISAIDLTNGREVGTITMPDCRRRAFASIVGVTSMGYHARHDGNLYAFRPDSMDIAWSITLGEHEIAGNREPLDPVDYCSANPTNGESLFSTPAIAADGVLYVGAGDGWLYRIRDASWIPQ